MDIRDKITAQLDEIERCENVRILYCAESGSRAWGFASPDSDYDVRFVYVRRPQDYLRLEDARDVIEWQLDDVYDINGWDLKKALILLHKSNCTLFEWDGSPIVYRTTPEWSRIAAVMYGHFSVKAGMYHYLNMAEHNYHAYFKGDTVKLKKYLYVLRPLLACRHILAKGEPPPMLFSDLMERYLDGEIREETDRLLQMKLVTSEMGTAAHIPVLDRYIEDTIAELETVLRDMPSPDTKDISELDGLFRDIVMS